MRAARDSGTRVTWAIVGCQQGNTIVSESSQHSLPEILFTIPDLKGKKNLILKICQWSNTIQKYLYPKCQNSLRAISQFVLKSSGEGQH